MTKQPLGPKQPKSKVTILSEYKEGWKDLPKDLYTEIEETMVQSLAISNNVPDRVERLREILNRSNLIFESSDDLVEFVRQSKYLELDSREQFVSIVTALEEAVVEQEKAKLERLLREEE